MKRKSMHPQDDRLPSHLADHGCQGFGQPRLDLSLGDTLGIRAQIEEGERIAGSDALGDESHGVLVGQLGDAGGGGDQEVVPALEAHPQRGLQLRGEDEGLALLAVLAIAFRCAWEILLGDLNGYILSHARHGILWRRCARRSRSCWT